MRSLLFLLALLGLALPAFAQTAAPARPALIVLAYHDVRDDVGLQADRDPDATSTDHLISHFDWLKANGYSIVSLQQVIDASHGGAVLPANAVLLTFDDGLESFYTRVYPLLRAYNYPAVAAIVGSWMDMPAGKRMPYNGSDCDRDCFLTWDQVTEMHKSGLVEFASHSWALHEGSNANPQGNLLPAAASLHYDDKAHVYENEGPVPRAYRCRSPAQLRRDRRAHRRPSACRRVALRRLYTRGPPGGRGAWHARDLQPRRPPAQPRSRQDHSTPAGQRQYRREPPGLAHASP